MSFREPINDQRRFDSLVSIIARHDGLEVCLAMDADPPTQGDSISLMPIGNPPARLLIAREGAGIPYTWPAGDYQEAGRLAVLHYRRMSAKL